MTLGHPLVDAALADLRLGVVDLRVFRVMWGQLNFERFVEKKSEVLAIEIGADRSHVSAAVRRLVEMGYLEREERPERAVQAYRLPRLVPTLGAETPKVVESSRARRQLRSSL